MEDIADADYMHAKRVWNEDFEIKHFGECHGLSLKSVHSYWLSSCWKHNKNGFRSSWNRSRKICFSPKICAVSSLLLMVEKGIKGWICHSLHRCAKAINKYMKNYDKNKELSNLKNWDVIDLYAWAMYQKLPVSGL